MTVKEIIIAAAAELGIADEVRAYVDGTADDGKGKTEDLLRCFNLVENELALDYLPLYAEDEFESTTGAIYYTQFERGVVRVLGVEDEWGNAAAFKLFPEYLKTQSGKVRVRYTYTPEAKGLDGESDFVLNASVRLFAYGIAAEYALANGLFEDAAVWDKKYKDAIGAAYRLRSGKKIRSRRWA
ncbi:MAG: hypothetical protein IJX91_01200 [Clostridia bacterium]|nr:hypothetical protein [Clostridia bacterium]